MKEPRVYADLCLLINFTMDFAILWTTAKLAGFSIRYRRLISASFLGAIYAIGFLFPALHLLYGFPAKIIMSVFLIMIAFSPRSWQAFKQSFLYFYGVCFTLAGASMAVSFLFKSGTEMYFPLFCLFGGLFCAFLIGSYADQYFSSHLIPGLLNFNIEFRFGDQRCYAEALLDTGNALRDPLSQRPVVVAEYALLKSCIPKDFQMVMEQSRNEDEILDALTRTTWAHRLRLIPFSSIGKKNGLMIGLRCDEIIVKGANKRYQHRNLVVGMYLDKLSSRGDYQVLIPSEILLNT